MKKREGRKKKGEGRREKERVISLLREHIDSTSTTGP